MDLSTSPLSSQLERVRTALQALHGLALFHHVLHDEPAREVLHLLRLLTANEPDPVAIAQAYGRAFNALALAVTAEGLLRPSDAWQAYLITRICDDRNPWSMQAERVGVARAGTVSPALHDQAQRELRALQRLFQLDASSLLQLTRDLVTPSIPALDDAWVPWYDLAVPDPFDRQHRYHTRDALALAAVTHADWGELTTTLEELWSRHGTGPLAHYTVLRWQSGDKRLAGVAHPDPIRLDELIGYEREKSILRVNIERFLAGLPAHDALLYGSPGTGKSSTIKALVNYYEDRGLRLVEVSREDLDDLPQVVAQLREHAPRYILFIDDLSFEEHDTGYKALKVWLEGTAEARPCNVLVHATSNRFNLVREQFGERGKPSDDVHWRDTMDEKQSLVHRFGLRVTFSPPDQQDFLDIVVGLANVRGLAVPEEMLRARALQWERQHVGRSGRLARQFIDGLEAEIREQAAQDEQATDAQAFRQVP